MGGKRKCEICGAMERHQSGFFANFPLDEIRCKTWVKLVGNKDLVYLPIEKLHELRHICGDHFEKKDFNKKDNRLKKKAFPKLKLSAQPLSDEVMKDFPQHLPAKTVLVTVEPVPSTSAQIPTVEPVPSTSVQIPTVEPVPSTSAQIPTVEPVPSTSAQLPTIVQTETGANDEMINRIQDTNVHKEAEENKHVGEPDERMECVQYLGDTSEPGQCAIEKILAKRFNMLSNRQEFLLRLRGHPLKQYTWATVNDMAKCKHLVEDFESQLMKQKELRKLKPYSQSKQVSETPTVTKVDTKAATPTNNKPTNKVRALKRECDLEDGEPLLKIMKPASTKDDDDDDDFYWEDDSNVSMTNEIIKQVSPKRCFNSALDNRLNIQGVPKATSDINFPSEHNKTSVNTTEALKEMAALDVFVCGQCHSAFHFNKDFTKHKEVDNCTEISPLRDSQENLTQVWGYLLWKNSRVVKSSDKGFRASEACYSEWRHLPERQRGTWVAAGDALRRLADFTQHKTLENSLNTQYVVNEQTVNEKNKETAKKYVNTRQKLTNTIPQDVKQTTQQINRLLPEVQKQTGDQINSQQRVKQVVKQTHNVVEQVVKAVSTPTQQLPKQVIIPIRRLTPKKITQIAKKSDTATTTTWHQVKPDQPQCTLLMPKLENDDENKLKKDPDAAEIRSSEESASPGEQKMKLSPSEDAPGMFRGENGVLYRVAGENKARETLLLAVDEAEVDLADSSKEECQDPLSLEAWEGAAPLQQVQVEGECGEITAQLLRVLPPRSDGRRRIVLLLPDGSLTMAELDKEQYELIKQNKSQQ